MKFNTTPYDSLTKDRDNTANNMGDQSIYIGNSSAHLPDSNISGKLVTFENEPFYKISNYDAMRPFFMSIVSDSNHWMFISSNGGLTAGRKNSDAALFPYYTDDKITDLSHSTGNKTIFRIARNNKTFLWEPFSDRYEGIYQISRNLYKSRFGNKIVFEEINHNLELTFQYQWNSSNLFGFVKRSKLLNHSDNDVQIAVLDGIQNIVPYGVGEALQNAYSNLVDAYKRNELLDTSGMGLFTLSAIIVDKAEPSEALRSTVAWSTGLENPTYLLSSLQLKKFIKGQPLTQETDVKAEKGAYFVASEIILHPSSDKEWLIVANVNQSMVDIVELSNILNKRSDVSGIVKEDIERGTKRLLELNGASDGLQASENKLRNTRHFANTLFNIMRGGIFDDNYSIEKTDFVNYIGLSNRKVLKKKEEILNRLPEKFTLSELRDIANASVEHNEDINFKRLCYEYMPLKFSRRHGDPSRPWNQFSINTRSEVDGSKILDYQGNWRDIFQNWEALVHAYPAFIESMIFKFVNASTFDGYNPYRVMKIGFDWETIEPHDPWSYIGYWGDHQVIYLLKFLEFIEDHYPNRLATYFDQDVFVYANVPYKIKSYSDILSNPKDTIIFDAQEEQKILQKKNELGADGALLRDQNYFIYKVNLIEKLLAITLSKLSNFIPEAGIWMNTQRPEWNDANNALVGNGVSMVTLYYLRRFLKHFQGILSNTSLTEANLSVELTECFEKISQVFQENLSIINGSVSDTDRKNMMDGLGQAASDYRDMIYRNGFSSNKESVTINKLSDFITTAILYLDHSIEANKRDDKLYHAYNLMTIENDHEVSISHLPEMLEGQVAVLSSGYIGGRESLDLLDALKRSALFRHDQYSYILYPNKELPGFAQKNIIPAEAIEQSQLLNLLIQKGDTRIVEKDSNGVVHFNSTFNNAGSLKMALDDLSDGPYGELIPKEEQQLLELFEEVFDHKSFTGRSGTFFGYEGLGSIYWHMVSKLLLSVQETCLKAINDHESAETIGRLMEHYYEINEGIGVHKSPELYGAFPTDPYSHTPQGKGAQQPGMTGQVKEDILCRFGELGVLVEDGKLHFKPNLLRRTEFLREPRTFSCIDIKKTRMDIDLPIDSMAFTYCQIPVIYKIESSNALTLHYQDQSVKKLTGLSLDIDTSQQVFHRTGNIIKIEVGIEANMLR